jgi:glycosyltransferase involved in cell wall biosynthesis
MLRRPRLLFLAYYFPPVNSAGCVRTWNIAKHLSRAGWDVKVVTPHPSVWRRIEDETQTVIDLEKEGIQRVLTGHRSRYLLPGHLRVPNEGIAWLAGGLCRQVARYLEIDPAKGWAAEVLQSCKNLSGDDADVILASGSPFSAFGLAYKLSRHIGRPYIMDYRDPWTGNPHSVRCSRPTTIQLERQLLSNSAAVTIVSPSLAVDLDYRFHLGSKLKVISNGFCPEDLNMVHPFRFDHFAIVYTGEFYPPKRVISPLAAALQQLKRSKTAHRPWRFHYYGSNESHVRDAANRFGLTQEVVLHGKVSRREALSAVRGADVAVVITSVEEQGSLLERGIVTGKLFEAIGLGTPTLLISPPGGDVEAIVAETGLARCYAGNDIAGISSLLEQAMLGDLPVPKRPEAYSWPVIVQDLDALLREVVGLKASTVPDERREPTRVKA